MFERSAKFLQIHLDVGEYAAPLRRRIPNGTTSLFKRVVIVSRCCVACKKNKSSRADDHRAPPPWHNPIPLQFLMSDKLQFSLHSVFRSSKRARSVPPRGDTAQLMVNRAPGHGQRPCSGRRRRRASGCQAGRVRDNEIEMHVLVKLSGGDPMLGRLNRIGARLG